MPKYNCWIRANKDIAEISNKSIIVDLFRGIYEDFDFEDIVSYTFGLVSYNKEGGRSHSASLLIDIHDKDNILEHHSLTPLVLTTDSKDVILQLISAINISFKHKETIVNYFDSDDLDDFSEKIKMMKTFRKNEKEK